jgi:hypothetical protein
LDLIFNSTAGFLIFSSLSLVETYGSLPRAALRYAIEKMSKALKEKAMER